MLKTLRIIIVTVVFLLHSSLVYAKSPITFGGKNAIAVCTFMYKYVQPCNVSRKYQNDSDALEAIRNGEIDLAIVPYAEIKENDKAHVIMLTSRDQKRVLVARSTLDNEIVKNITKLYLDAFSPIGWTRKIPILSSERFKFVQLSSGNIGFVLPFVDRKRQNHFFLFDKNIPLHAGMMEYYRSESEKPLYYGGGPDDCDKIIGNCGGMASSESQGINIGIGRHLADLGLSAIPFLIPMLEDKNKYVRIRAAFALGYMNPQDVDKATPSLINLLNNEQDDDVRQYALQALSRMKPVKPEVIELFKKIASEKQMEREVFINASNNGFHKDIYIGTLSIANQASLYLAKFSPKDVSFFKDLLNSESKKIQINAIKGLTKIVSLNIKDFKGKKKPIFVDLTLESQEAIKLLRSELLKSKGEAYNEILFSLGSLGTIAANSYVVSAISKELYNTEEQCGVSRQLRIKYCRYHIQNKAMIAMRKMAEIAGTPEVYKGLLYIVENGSSGHSSTALHTFVAISRYNKIPSDILDSLNDFTPSNKNDRHGYNRGLEKLGIEDKINDSLDHIEELTEQLFDDSDDKYDRSEAVKELANFLKQNHHLSYKIIPIIIHSLEEEKDAQVLRYKIRNLGMLGILGKDVIPYLTKKLRFGIDWQKTNSVGVVIPPPYSQFWRAPKTVIEEFFYKIGINISKKRHIISKQDVQWIRSNAAVALFRIGIHDKKAITELKKVIEWAKGQYGEHQLLSDASNALLKLSNEKEKISLAIKFLKTESRMYYQALSTLEKLGPKAKDAIDAIKPLTKHKDKGFRQLAMKTLKAIGTEEALAIKEIEPPKPKPALAPDWEEYLVLWYKQKYEKQ